MPKSARAAGCRSTRSGSTRRPSPTANSPVSSPKPAIAPMPKSRRTRPIIRAWTRRWRSPDRWCSCAARVLSRSMIRRTGGRSCSVRTGAIRPVPTATLREWTTIPSSISPIAMRKPMPIGQGSRCRPKRNGNGRRAAGWKTGNMPGATSLPLMARSWRITGAACSPLPISARMAAIAPPRSAASRPTAMASAT